MSRARTRKSPAPATPPRIATVECPLCAHANDAEARFCNSCGARVDLVTCAACEAINPRDSGSCYRCGASMSQRKAGETAARAAVQPPPAESLVESTAATALPSVQFAPTTAPVDPHGAVVETSKSPETPLIDEVEPGRGATVKSPEEPPADAPAIRRRWMRSVVLLVPIVGAVGFLAFPRGDLESIPPPPAPVPALPSAAAPPPQVEAPRASDAAALPATPSDASSARQDASTLPEPATAHRDAAVADETPAQVTQQSSKTQSANAPSASPRPRTAERRPRAHPSSRPPATIAAPEPAGDATSATLRDQINAGSRRAVSCTVDARALGLCPTP